MQEIESHKLAQVVNPSLDGGETRAFERATPDGRFAGSGVFRVFGPVFIAAEIEALAVDERADFFHECKVHPQKFLDGAGDIEAIGE